MTADARKRVEAWIDQIKAAKDDKAQADAHADADSLARAADLEAIYADMSWVADMPPVPKRKGRGRRVDPKSREQFAKWLMQTYGWGTPGRLSHLHQAHEFSIHVKGIRPTGEACIRPLGRLRAQGYGSQQAQVWAAAVERAGGECPTAAQVTAEVTAYLKKMQPTENAAADPRTKEEKRQGRLAKALAEFETLLAEDNRLADKFLDKAMEHFNEHQVTLKVVGESA